jgi:hypothetical protein
MIQRSSVFTMERGDNKMSTVFRKLEENSPSYLTDLLDSVDEQWRSEFERFVETGEADDAFLTYLDQDEGAQQAVEAAFKRQAAKFEGLAAELKRRQAESSSIGESHRVAAASTTPTKVAAVVEDALQATSAQRDQVVANSTAALAASMPAEEAVVVKQVARSLESSLAGVADVTHS